MSTIPGIQPTGPGGPPAAPAPSSPLPTTPVVHPHVTLPDTQTSSHQLSMSDEETVRFVRELFYRARSYRRPIIATWNRNYRLLRNRTWLADRAAWLPSPEVPEIRPIISQLSGWMTDQRPTYTAVPAASPPHSLLQSNLQDR